MAARVSDISNDGVNAIRSEKWTGTMESREKNV